MNEPFGYFRAEPFGWTDCGPDDDGAKALYEWPANTQLTDAAPELLEVLKELAALDFGAQIMNDDDTRRIDFAARKARAAIAKAEGKA